MFASHKKFAVAVVGVFILAFGVRLALASAFVGLGAPPDASANPDQLDFEAIAWEVAQGHGFSLPTGEPTARRAVGAVGTMVPPYLVAGRSFAAGRVWLVLLSSATCLYCVWIGAAGFGRGVGLLAGVALAVYPGHAYYAMHFVSEGPFAFWLALAAALSLHGLRHAWRWRHLLAGAAWGCAILTKPQFVLLVPGVLGLLAAIKIAAALRGAGASPVLCSNAAISKNAKTGPIPAAFITCLAAVLCVAPWGVRNYTVMGTPGLSTIVGHTLWGSNNERVLHDPTQRGLWVRTSDLERDLSRPLPEGEAAANDAATGYAVAFAKAHKGALPGMALSKLRRLVTPWPVTENRAVRWAEALAWMAVAPFGLLGVCRWWRERRAQACALLAPIAVTLMVTVVFYGSVRFRNALAPLLVVFAAAGVGWVAERLGRSRSAESVKGRGSRLPATC